MKNSISLILIVLAVALGYFYILPEYATVMALRTQKADYDDTISKTKQIKATTDGLLQKYNSISDSDKASLENMIPSQFDLITFTNNITALGSRDGVSIKGIKAQDSSSVALSASRSNILPEVSVGGYKTTSLTFAVTATYPVFLKFLKDLETNRELIDIKGLSVAGGGSYGAPLTFTLVIDTYSIK